MLKKILFILLLLFGLNSVYGFDFYSSGYILTDVEDVRNSPPDLDNIIYSYGKYSYFYQLYNSSDRIYSSVGDYNFNYSGSDGIWNNYTLDNNYSEEYQKFNIINPVLVSSGSDIIFLNYFNALTYASYYNKNYVYCFGGLSDKYNIGNFFSDSDCSNNYYGFFLSSDVENGVIFSKYLLNTKFVGYSSLKGYINSGDFISDLNDYYLNQSSYYNYNPISIINYNNDLFIYGTGSFTYYGINGISYTFNFSESILPSSNYYYIGTKVLYSSFPLSILYDYSSNTFQELSGFIIYDYDNNSYNRVELSDLILSGVDAIYYTNNYLYLYNNFNYYIYTKSNNDIVLVDIITDTITTTGDTTTDNTDRVYLDYLFSGNINIPGGGKIYYYSGNNVYSNISNVPIISGINLYSIGNNFYDSNYCYLNLDFDGYVHCVYNTSYYQKNFDIKLSSGFSFIPDFFYVPLNYSGINPFCFVSKDGVHKCYDGGDSKFVSIENSSISLGKNNGFFNNAPDFDSSSCPVSGYIVDNSFINWKLGGQTVLGFTLPAWKPFLALGCTFQIIYYGLDYTDNNTILNLSGGKQVIDLSLWGDNINSGSNSLPFGDLLIYMIVFMLFFIGLNKSE